MSERRKHDRVQKEIRFHCYIDGNRFDSASVNLSQGGAFLRTQDPIPTDSVVVAVPRQQYLQEFPVMLVGKVLRRQNSSDKGLGLEWQRCVTRSGFDRLWQFIETFPELWETLPAKPANEFLSQPCVGFDFSSGSFFLPKGRFGPRTKGSAAPAAGEPSSAAPASAPAPASDVPVDLSYAGRPALSGSQETTTVYSSSRSHPPEVVMPMGTAEFNTRLKESTVREPTPLPMPGPATSDRLENPPKYRRTASSGAITQVIERYGEEFPTNIPVSIKFEARTYEARIRMLSLSTFFVLSFDQELFDAEKLEIELPISLHQRIYTVTLPCTVIRTGQHVDAGGPGIHLRIDAVYQPQRPGIFERYVKFLYYQTVSGR